MHIYKYLSSPQHSRKDTYIYKYIYTCSNTHKYTYINDLDASIPLAELLEWQPDYIFYIYIHTYIPIFRSSDRLRA